MKSKNYLHIISSTGVGGAEKMLYKFLCCKGKPFEHITVVSLTGIGDVGKSMQNSGIRVISLDLHTRYGIFMLVPRIILILLKYRPSVIVSWMYHANLIAFVMSLLGGCHVVWNIRCGLTDLNTWSTSRRTVLNLNKILSTRVNRIIYNSNRSKTEHSTYGFDNDHSVVVYNGFDIKDSLDLASKNISRDDFYINKECFLIGAFGRNVPVKRMNDLLSVCSCLRLRQIPVQILFIGRYFNTENFKNIIEEKHLTEYVHVLEETPLNYNHYRLLDAFCLCSESEGFPNVVGEAVFSRVPVFTSDISDMKEEFLDDWQVKNVGDIQGLAEAATSIYFLTTEEKDSLVSKQFNSFYKHTHMKVVCEKLNSYFYPEK